MKIVIFGIGEIYRRNKCNISAEDNVIAFLDNNKSLQGTKCDGIEVYSPVEIEKILYEKIVIMSTACVEMRDQLLQLGCKREKIVNYIEYISQCSGRELRIYDGKTYKDARKNCLIITSLLGYHGGPITAIYMALALQNMGYKVVIASPIEDRMFIDEFSKSGITFYIYPNMQFAKWNEVSWINDFDKIIVNTYPMWLCALEIVKHRDVAVWLHESNVAYPSMEFWKDIIIENMDLPNLKVYAVSRVARENFFHNVAEMPIDLLPYGIPDFYHEVTKSNKKLTFAVIGTIHPIKGQKLFLDAVKVINKLYSNCSFFIIGKEWECNADYISIVRREAEMLSNVQIIGELTRTEMESMYCQIDVVVVPSSQETMSLAATEAMMNGKVCIISDIAGMAEYVKQGENGLTFHAEDVDDLVKQMLYCIRNWNSLQALKKNARVTYEKFFSLEVFGRRLEQILNNNKKKLVVYGLGNNFKMLFTEGIYQRLEQEFDLVGFVDKNCDFNKGVYGRFFCCSDILDKEFDYICITSTRFYSEIRDELLGKSVDECKILPPDFWKEFCLRNYLPIDMLKGKGIEIGGPSDIFQAVYRSGCICDGVNYDMETVWGNYSGPLYQWNEKILGKQVTADATDLKIIKEETYDFVLSSNNLEHIANPMKAVSEFCRILKKGGLIVILVPCKQYSFDHKREDTTFEHILEDYKNDISEEDMTHLDEILSKHDLALDKPAGTKEQFRERSRNNFQNRCLHHHVFSIELLKSIADYFELEILENTMFYKNYLLVGRKKQTR